MLEIDLTKQTSAIRVALSYRDFRRYALGRFLATIAWQMLGVAVGWQVYSITNDPLDLGLVGLAQFLPFLALVLPGGHLADRYDRRKVMVCAYLIETLCAAVLIFFTLSGLNKVWPVFVAMALFGAGRAFWMPAGQAMAVNLVPAAVFPSAVAANAFLFEAAVITGPALGGILYAIGDGLLINISGALLVYTLSLGLLISVVILLFGIRPMPNLPTKKNFSLYEFTEGLRFVMNRKILLGAISLDLCAVLFGGATALLPMFAADILNVGTVGLGILRSSPAIGAGIMGLALTYRPITRHVGGWMFGGVVVYGLGTIAFGASDIFWVSCLALFIIGAGDMLSVFVRQLLVQLETPDEIRGRVSAVSSMFIGASNELGEFESGLTASWWGPVRAVVIGGSACLISVGLYLKIFPQLRTLDHFPERNTQVAKN